MAGDSPGGWCQFRLPAAKFDAYVGLPVAPVEVSTSPLTAEVVSLGVDQAAQRLTRLIARKKAR